MIIDAELVSKVAALASLELTPSERDQMSVQLTRIVEHFEALRSIPEDLLTESSDPAPSPLRADQSVDSGMRGILERNAPEFAHGHFVVPRVVTRGE